MQVETVTNTLKDEEDLMMMSYYRKVQVLTCTWLSSQQEVECFGTGFRIRHSITRWTSRLLNSSRRQRIILCRSTLNAHAFIYLQLLRFVEYCFYYFACLQWAVLGTIADTLEANQSCNPQPKNIAGLGEYWSILVLISSLLRSKSKSRDEVMESPQPQQQQ